MLFRTFLLTSIPSLCSLAAADDNTTLVTRSNLPSVTAAARSSNAQHEAHSLGPVCAADSCEDARVLNRGRSETSGTNITIELEKKKGSVGGGGHGGGGRGGARTGGGGHSGGGKGKGSRLGAGFAMALGMFMAAVGASTMS